jgi:diguanylate cyclase
VTVALDLLAEMDADPDPMWRAKALALLAESSTHVNEVSRAMDALAEGAWLVAHTEPYRYSHLSASTAVAVSLRAVYLFEQADELLDAIKLGAESDVDLLVVQERALMNVFWATTLFVVGDAKNAARHLVRAAEQSLKMPRLARHAGSCEMAARAEVIEAYAISRLGYAGLAAARVHAAIRRFRTRDELVETHLAHLVLAQAAAEARDYGDARLHLHAALANAKHASREIWAAAAIEALADLDVAEHGPHPAVDPWKRLAREAQAGLGRARRPVHQSPDAQPGARPDRGDEPDGSGRAARPAHGSGKPAGDDQRDRPRRGGALRSFRGRRPVQTG